MRIRFTFEKKNMITFGIFSALAVIMLVMTGYPAKWLCLFEAGYFLIKTLKFEVSEKAQSRLDALPWLWTALMFAVGSVITTLCVQHVILDAELYAETSKRILHYNFMAVALVYLIFFVIIARPTYAAITAHCVLTSLAFADYFVYEFRQNELTLSDFTSIGTGISVLASYRLKLHDRGALAILASIICIAFVRRLHIQFKKKWLARITGGIATVILFLVLHGKVANIETQTWELKGSYQNGYVLNFMLSIGDRFVSKPDGYSEEAVSELEKQYAEETSDSSESGTEITADTGDKKPTIIAIMDESFADLSVFGDLKTNKEVTPFINSLEENTIKGYTLSSVFGAKTPNSEWEFLTGNSMAFLPSGAVVYEQYLNKKPYSLVTELDEEGYTTVAMHPYYASGWKRKTVYPKLGFDEQHFMDDGYFDETNICREYITDEELFNKIISRYEEQQSTDSDSPLFIFGVTMQNHGGYSESYANFTEDVHVENSLSYLYTQDVDQYLSLAHKTDEAVEELITYFESVDEPVEIVFFGDHQPSLNSVFYESLNGKGMSGLTMDELMEFYKVPFFIWTNYDSTSMTIDCTSNNYLSTLTLEKSGLELPAYNRFLADLMEKIPAINSRGYYSLESGGFVHLEDASGEEADWINKYQILQYNSMFDKKNRSEEFFPYPITDD